MMKVWLDLRSHINWFFVVSAFIIVIVITLTSTVMVNKIFQADRQKAETMAMAERNSQLASIGQLAAGVAHEINNPLALINETAGYVKDLFMIKQQYKEDPDLVEHIDSIIDAVERCGTITRQLLGFARHFDVQTQPIDLEDMVADVINFHKKEAEYRNITIHVDIPETIPLIETDRGKLQQIILNLVNNAFQAIDNGCFLDIQAEMDGPEHVRLSIRDNGCGISEDAPQQGIRALFYDEERRSGYRSGPLHYLRPGPKTSWKHHGSKQNGRRHHLRCHAARPTQEGNPIMKVLLVDDEQKFALMLAKRLELRGIQVDVFFSGEKALETVEQGNRFDVAILDVKMPGIGGIELKRRLGAAGPADEICLSDRPWVQNGLHVGRP